MTLRSRFLLLIACGCDLGELWAVAHETPFYAFCLLPSLGRFSSGPDDIWTPALALVASSEVANVM